jgi:general secretion pathway protein L
MADQLFIRPGTDVLQTDSLVDWFFINDQGQIIDKGNCALSAVITACPRQTKGIAITLIVPAKMTLLTRVAIPATQARQVNQALPFMVEELIAEDIESVHIATEQQLDPRAEHYDIAVISHEALINLLDVMAHCGIKLKAMIPEVHLLPYQTRSMTIVVDEQQLLLRWGDYTGSAVAAEHCHLLSDLIKDELTKHDVQHVHLIAASNASGQVIDSLKRQFNDYELKETHYQEPSSELLAGQAMQSQLPAFNLLQGGYGVAEGERFNGQKIQRFAAVAAITLVIYLLAALGSGFYFQQKADHIESQSYSLYRELFPAERRVVSPKRQMQSHLGRAGKTSSGDGFLALLGSIASNWSGNGKKPELNQLRYSVSRNQLQMEVKTQSIDELDQFKQRLNAAGVAVEINSANEQENFVLGRISVGAL